ncbi:hypothetical protein [Pseudomonas atagonensis]|uniref:hypothetical protein n=1 Tax=Pseudomonas atagonensis TaxID=2609964 RepID=UPI00140742F7|nr:hypothetical protein [Pseudomonas atagonensis]
MINSLFSTVAQRAVNESTGLEQALYQFLWASVFGALSVLVMIGQMIFRTLC